MKKSSCKSKMNMGGMAKKGSCKPMMYNKGGMVKSTGKMKTGIKPCKK